MYYTYYNYVVIKTFRLIFVDNLTYDFRSFSISYLFIFTLSMPWHISIFNNKQTLATLIKVLINISYFNFHNFRVAEHSLTTRATRATYAWFPMTSGTWAMSAGGGRSWICWWYVQTYVDKGLVKIYPQHLKRIPVTLGSYNQQEWCRGPSY